MNSSALKGTVLLLITALIWGTAFVAQTSAADNVDPFTFNASRNIIAVVFLTMVITVKEKLETKEAKPAAAPASPAEKVNFMGDTRAIVIGGALCGLALFAASYLQQAGIGAYPPEAAASGRAGFITATYVIMVALCSLFMGKKVHPLVLVATVVCVVGMYLLCMSGGIEGIYMGDVLVLLSAAGFAAHIIVIDRYVALDAFRLSRVQFIASGGLSLICALIFEQPTVSAIALALLPILFAGIMSDGVAYTLQFVGQKFVNATAATIIMSLESVFAALAGWLLLAERLGVQEIIGCALVFAAVMLAQAPDFLKKPAEGEGDTANSALKSEDAARNAADAAASMAIEAGAASSN